MVAASPHAETTPVNRTAAYFAKTVEGDELPATDHDRYEFFTAAIMKAVARLSAMLDSDDPKQVMHAADMLLGLERTRIRHARNVIGCEQAAPVEVAVAPSVEDADEFDGVIPSKSTFKKVENNVVAMACHTAEVKKAFNQRAESKPGKYKLIDDSEAEAIVRRHLKINKRRAFDIMKDGFVSWAMFNLDHRLGYTE